MIHPLADCQSKNVGPNTSIWQYAVILPDAVIGGKCNINCHTFIENDVQIGNGVTIKSGVYLWDGLRVGDDVFIGPSVVFTNDLRPRSKQRVEFLQTTLESGCSIGANSSIRAGVIIGKYALVGMGSVVLNDVPPYAVVYGNPARVKGWVDERGEPMFDIGEGRYRSVDNRIFEIVDNRLIELI